MSEGKFCRICVRKDVKMYEYDRFHLKLFYKEITGSKVSKRDCLPKWFCFECAALLHKFHEFKKKCHNGQNVFKKLLESKSASRNNFTRYTSPQSHLQIISVHRNNSIKTYTIKHGEIKQSISQKKQNNFTEVYVADSKIIEFNSRSNENDDTRSDKPVEQNDDDNDIHNDSNDSLFLNGNAENDNQFIMNIEDDDDNDIHNDSNDSLFLNGNAENDNQFIMKIEDKQNENRKTNSTERTTNEVKSDKKINIFDEKTGNFTTNIIEKDQTYKIDNTKIREIIKSQTDILNESNIEPNLVNKFQRSVKKKFLDENHWTKITLSDEEASRRFQAKALEQKYLRADFKCTDCYRTFSQEDMMKRHIKLRHCKSLGPHECKHCRMRFKWKSRLQKHLKEHYTIYKCLRCELSFPVEISAFQHDYSHNGVTWTCAHCGQGFRHSSTYYTHLRKHKSKYVCTLCGVSFVSEFGLFMHKRVKHVISEDMKEESSDTYCKVCDIKFDTLKGYEDHFAESALHATEGTEGATSLPLKTRCTKRRVPRIATTCNICGRSFSTYAAFSKHHACAHPGAPLPRARDKQNGQRQVCEVCGITLASSWSLLNHLNTHSRSHRFTCKTCGLQLTSRSVLQRHQLTHSLDKSFTCDLCSKRFTHLAGLRMHLRKHEKEQGSPGRKKETQHVMDYFKHYGPLGNSFGYETKKL